MQGGKRRAMANSLRGRELALSEDAGGAAIAGRSASFGGRCDAYRSNEALSMWSSCGRRSDRPRLRFEAGKSGAGYERAAGSKRTCAV